MIQQHYEVVTAANLKLDLFNVFCVFHLWTDAEEVTVEQLLDEVHTHFGPSLGWRIRERGVDGRRS